MSSAVPLAQMFAAQVAVATPTGPAGQEVEVATLGIPLTTMAASRTSDGRRPPITHVLVSPSRCTRISEQINTIL